MSDASSHRASGGAARRAARGTSALSVSPQPSLAAEEELLPPNQWLSDQAFEDFTELLLSASKFTDPGITHVTSITRWGEPGEKQNGIDFAGTLSDGRTASWQCKRYRKFTPALVAKAVRDNTYTADVHHLVLSCKASRPVKEEIAKHPGWVLIDQRTLKQKLDELHRHKRRDVLQETFGSEVRRRLMASPGQDLVISLDDFVKDRLAPHTILNDRGPFSGRHAELATLLDALIPGPTSPQVVLLTGPGGRGKTRLLLEALRREQERDPHRPIVVMAPGVSLTPEVIQELPGAPAVVAVDDIHRDASALEQLLAYQRSVPGTQILLGCRPSGAAEVEAALAARLGPRDRITVEVDQLPRKHAYALVKGLAGGLDLDWNLHEHLAGQAVDSPHVVVITVNLIRRNELTQALAVDTGLRQSVMRSYVDIAAGMASGVTDDHVNTLLAIYAALHGVRDEDERADAHLRELTGLTQRQLLQTRERLRDRGVLVSRQGSSVVLPEVLGDQALETEACIDGRDTGFAAQIWQRFATSEGPLLLGSLAELEWRLRQRDGGNPDVLSAVWTDLRERLLRDDLDEVLHYLRSLDTVTFTHPARFVDLLDDLRARLTRPPASQTTTIQDPSDSEHRPVSAFSRRRRRFTFRPTTVADVLQKMAPLYGRCAANDPALLEQSLDALWALLRHPQQVMRTHQDHPERVVAEMLADLGQLPDDSFPMRLIEAVQRWLLEPFSSQPAGAVSPLPLLAPLLVKQTHRTSQSGRRTFEVSQHVVSAAWAEALRTRIRVLLQEQASGADFTRAGEAVSLLGSMLQPVHLPAGVSLGAEQGAVWDRDELATVQTLRKSAQASPSAAVRRHIRHEVAWTAEHASAATVRQHALDLINNLDQLVDDDVAEALMPQGLYGLPHRRVLVAPSPQRQPDSPTEAHREGRSSAETTAAPVVQAASSSTWERHLAAGRDAGARAVAVLVQHDSAAAIVTAIDAAAREVEAVTKAEHGPVALRALYLAMDQAVPELVPGFLDAIAANPQGPLDQAVDQLAESWRRRDPRAALTWLRRTTLMRADVRCTIARGWQLHPWLGAGADWQALFDLTTADALEAVRHTALAASFARYPGQPARAVQLLLDGDAPSDVCERALRDGTRGDPQAWGAQLGGQDAQAVMALAERTGWEDWTVQQVAAGVAANYPELVLEHLVASPAEASGRGGPSSHREGLPTALEGRAEQTASWLLHRCTQLSAPQCRHLSKAVFPQGLGPGVSDALEKLIHDQRGSDVLALAQCLQHLPLWPAHRPELARALLEQASSQDLATGTQVLGCLTSSLRLDTYSLINGVSTQLQAAHLACAQAGAAEVNPDLRQLFIVSRDRFARQIVMARKDHEEDYEEDNED